MESTSQAEAVPATPPQEAPKRKPIALVATIIAGLAAGGGVGLFVLGPTLMPRAQAQAAAPSAHAKKDTAKEADAAKYLHVVDNLVLNPAGSGGTRFLMVNATFEMKESSGPERMKAHDPEVRDVLLYVLGTKTVEELADVTRREALKKELLVALQKQFPETGVLRIYFPQFVIQ
jgi:flagellar FliL protein